MTDRKEAVRRKRTLTGHEMGGERVGRMGRGNEVEKDGKGSEKRNDRNTLTLSTGQSFILGSKSNK